MRCTWTRITKFGATLLNIFVVTFWLMFAPIFEILAFRNFYKINYKICNIMKMMYSNDINIETFQIPSQVPHNLGQLVTTSS